MSEQIKKSDISEKDIFEYIIVGAGKAQKEIDAMNLALKETAQISKNTLKAKPTDASGLKATEQAIKASNLAMKEKLKLENDLIKIEAQRLRAERMLSTEVERTAKATEKANQQAEKSISVYSRVDKWLGSLVREYRELAVRQQLGAKLTNDEIKRMETLSGRIQKYDQALKLVDETTGKHQRKVGDYKSAYNGLGNSVNQLTREMPAFANSMQTGFMAISNNLPIFFDEIQKLKEANIELQATGQPTKSILKQLGGAIFSVGTALSVGVTLLTIYGKEIATFVGELFKGKQAIDVQKVALEAYNETLEDYRNASSDASAKIKEMAQLFRMAKDGTASKDDVLKHYNDTLGSTLGYAENLNEAEAIYTKKSKAFIEATGLRAQAQALYAKAGDETAKALTASMDNNVKFADAFKETFNVAFANTQDLVKKANELQKQGTKEAVKDAKTRERIFTLEADQLLKKAMLLEKENDINLGGEKIRKEHVKKVKELDTALSDLNLTLKDERNILKEIDKLYEQNAIKRRSNTVNDVFTEQRIQVTTTGVLDVDELDFLINTQFDMEKEARLKQLKFDQDTLDLEINNSFDEKKKALEAERDELLKQKGITAKEAKIIDDNYKVKLNELNDYQLEQIRITELEKQKLALEAQQDLEGIDEKRAQEIEKLNDELIDLQIDYFKRQNELAEAEAKKEAERRKENFETAKKWVDLTADYFIKRSEEKIAQLDKEIEASQKQYDTFAELAKNGNIQAQQSLAEQQNIINEANRKKMAEQKRIERLKLAETAFNVYGAKVEAGDKNPLVSTIKDITLLSQFISVLPAFEDGTENTGANGRGVDGKGGFHAILHPHERVLTKEQNSAIGDLTNAELSNLALKYNTGQLIDLKRHDVAGNSYDLIPLLSEIKELQSIIKNKPEHNIELGKITQTTMQIVESSKRGNITNRNIYSIKRR